MAVFADRPLLLERFTVFAQVGLFALVGVAWSRLPRVAAAVAAPCWPASRCWASSFLRALPDEPPATAAVARFIRRGRQPGDVVVVDSPRALNKMLFYLKQEGVADLPVRCLRGVAGGEHYTHAVSLLPGEQVARVEDAARRKDLARPRQALPGAAGPRGMDARLRARLRGRRGIEGAARAIRPGRLKLGPVPATADMIGASTRARSQS